VPIDLLSLLEAIGTATQFLPINYEERFRIAAGEVTGKLLSILENCIPREPFRTEPEEEAQFKSAKSALVALISNPLAPDHSLHEELKTILPSVLAFSRAIVTGAATKQQAVLLVLRLRECRTKCQYVAPSP
jgi:hypothetical protein